MQKSIDSRIAEVQAKLITQREHMELTAVPIQQTVCDSVIPLAGRLFDAHLIRQSEITKKLTNEQLETLHCKGKELLERTKSDFPGAIMRSDLWPHKEDFVQKSHNEDWSYALGRTIGYTLARSRELLKEFGYKVSDNYSYYLRDAAPQLGQYYNVEIGSCDNSLLDAIPLSQNIRLMIRDYQDGVKELGRLNSKLKDLEKERDEASIADMLKSGKL